VSPARSVASLASPLGAAELGRPPDVVRSGMARGWESKAIESQQDDALTARQTRRDLTPEERAAAQRRATVELAIANTQAEIQAACRPAHRDMLRLKLEALKAALGTI
jgi:hypothetical protein